MGKPCPITMKAKFNENHIHICSGEKDHPSPDHKCSDPKCGRYFWKKGQLV